MTFKIPILQRDVQFIEIINTDLQHRASLVNYMGSGTPTEVTNFDRYYARFAGA